MANKRKYSVDELKDAVKNSTSVMGTLRVLGLKEAGGSHSHLTKKIKSLGIDTSHFTGRSGNAGIAHIGGPKRKGFEEVLVKKKSGGRQETYRLRRALIESGREYVCESPGCGVGNRWKGLEIVLEIHHKNGDWLDNRSGNLVFYCPNCHSQEENSLTGITDRSEYFRKYRQSRKLSSCRP